MSDNTCIVIIGVTGLCRVEKPHSLKDTLMRYPAARDMSVAVRVSTIRGSAYIKSDVWATPGAISRRERVAQTLCL